MTDDVTTVGAVDTMPAAHGRASDVIRAINRIFREALSARSEEQLGQLALSVAEQATGAAFSFMGEINHRTGLLDDLAISARGWAAFTGFTEAYPRGVAPRNFPIRGMFARILNEGRSLIVDDPATHPDRVGVPDGHPPLTSFLGVPLKLGDETIGMIGLGNRPGGFRDEDRAVAEEIAPAIVQALLSKRSEQALLDSRRRLRSVLEGLPQLVWIATDRGEWTWTSPQWTEYTGLSSAASLGQGWLDALHPEDRASAIAFWQGAGAAGALVMEGRLWHVHEARYRWFQTRAQPVRDEAGAIIEWFGTSTDIDDMRQMQDHQQLLVAELQHRVRNILTIVRSVFARTIASGGAIEEVADHFKGRLDALARTQVVVTNSPSGLVDLENLIRDELLSVGVADGPQVRLHGPDVALPARTAESLGLAIHELTTNAVKYGALKVREGSLAIHWTTNLLYDGRRRLVLQWDEHGVPAIPLAPGRHGFGSELIEEALPYQLGADTALEFRGGGVRCTISLALPDGAAERAGQDGR